jgi:DNA-binding SARP family transcriptional activator
VRALLAFLAVEAGRPHQRSALAGLLWPDHPEELARTNLRHVLRQLRQTMASPADAPALLLTTQQMIQLNPVSELWLDLGEFQSLLAASAACSQRISAY